MRDFPSLLAPLRQVGFMHSFTPQERSQGRNAPVRWVIVAGIASGAISMYGFYAAQPFLLQLYGDSAAYAGAPPSPHEPSKGPLLSRS